MFAFQCSSWIFHCEKWADVFVLTKVLQPQCTTERLPFVTTFKQSVLEWRPAAISYIQELSCTSTITWQAYAYAAKSPSFNLTTVLIPHQAMCFVNHLSQIWQKYTILWPAYYDAKSPLITDEIQRIRPALSVNYRTFAHAFFGYLSESIW